MNTLPCRFQIGQSVQYQTVTALINKADWSTPVATSYAAEVVAVKFGPSDEVTYDIRAALRVGKPLTRMTPSRKVSEVGEYLLCVGQEVE